MQRHPTGHRTPPVSKRQPLPRQPKPVPQRVKLTSPAKRISTAKQQRGGR
jgi:hypothetical protein